MSGSPSDSDRFEHRDGVSPSRSALSSSADPVVGGGGSPASEEAASVETDARSSPQKTLPEARDNSEGPDHWRPNELTAGSLLGPYQIVRKLGEGGMGAVFEARHTKLKKTVAVKVLPPEFSRSAMLVSRFEREMEAVGALDHPHIVRAMDAGEFHGTHFLVMEYVEGRDLSVMVEERGPRSVIEACEMIRQAAVGLAHAHQHGLVHRDIKPNNLFATKQSVIKILDLGLARAHGAASQDSDAGCLTVMGQVLGTPDYMAPEQWENTHTADGRADLYSLGCTFFFLLTGRAPYADAAHSSLAGKMRGHTTEPIPDLRAARREAVANRPKLVNDPLPDEVEALYRRLMAKLPEDRIATADELAKKMHGLVKSLRSSSGSGERGGVSPPVIRDVGKKTGGLTPPRSPDSKTSPDANRPNPADTPTLLDAPAAIPETAESAAPSSEADQFDFTQEFSEPTWPALSPATKRAKKSGKSASARGRSGSFKMLGLCLGGLAAVVLCGVILFKITKKDGGVNEVTVPDDTQKVEITSSESTNRKSEISQNLKSEISDLKSSMAEGSSQPPAMSAADTSDLGPIDFAAERKAAELVIERGGNVVLLIDGQSAYIGRNNLLPLPAGEFAVIGVNLINCTRLTDADLAEIGRLSRLINLDVLFTTVGDGGMQHLAGLSRLKHLVLAFTSVTDAGMESIAKLTELQTLNLSETQVSDQGLAKLRALQNLEGISCSRSMTAAGLEHLAHFPKLTFVGVKPHQFTAQGVALLGELPGLTKLNLVGATDTELVRLKTLKTLPQIQELILNVATITPEGLAPLASLPRLEELNVGDTKGFSDNHLARLESFIKLKTLLLHGTSVSDTGLLKLKALGGLESLRVTNTKVTKEGVAALHEMLPLCRIESDHGIFEKLASEVVIPKRAEVPPAVPVEPDKPAAGAAKTAVAKAGKSELVAVKVPRVEIPAALLPTKPNKAISNRATVSLPPPIAGLRGWSLEIGGHNGTISASTYSPDGQFVATVGESDDTVRIWKITEIANAPVLTLDRVFLGEEGGIKDVAWSPDGFTIATTSLVSRSVTLFDAPTGRMLKRITLTNGAGLSVDWSPDGQLLAATDDSQLNLIDPIRGVARISQRAAVYTDGCWSPDGSQLVTVDNVGRIKFWKPQALEPIAEIDTAERNLTRVAWSADGKWIATGGVAGVIQIWETATKKRVHELRAELGSIFGLSWEPAAAAQLPSNHPAWPRLAGVGIQGKLVVWDAVTGDKLLETTPSGVMTSVAWSPDGTQIAVTLAAHLELRDSVTGMRIATAELIGGGTVSAAINSLSSNGKELRIQEGTELTVWDADTGSFVKRVENLPSGWSFASPTDEWLAVFDPNSTQGNLHLVDTATYQNHRALVGHSSTITAVNWSSDGKTLASSSKDQTVRLWNTATGEQILSIPHPIAVQSVVWSPDSKRLATCGNDDVIRLWLAATGKAVGEFPRLPAPCTAGPSGLAWSPDDKYLAVTAYGGKTRVLDLKSGKLSDPILEFNRASQSVAWSADSKQLLAGSGGEVGYRVLTARESVTAFGYGSPVQWHPDRRRFLTGLVGYFPLQGLDAKRNAKIGALYPNIVGGHHVCISADGHYRGSNGIEQHLVYVALTKDGHQQTYSPADFAAKFNWKNDPTKARLLGADR